MDGFGVDGFGVDGFGVDGFGGFIFGLVLILGRRAFSKFGGILQKRCILCIQVVSLAFSFGAVRFRS